MNIKTCYKCKQEKSITEFGKDKYTKDGLNCRCKSCAIKYAHEHKDEIKKNYLKHKDERNIYNKQYYSEHKEEMLQQNKQWCLNNPEKKKLCDKNYYHNNKDKVINRVVVYERKRLKNDPIFRILKHLRRRMCLALKSQGVKKSLHNIELLGCTDLIYQEHLKSLFKPKMLLENTAPRKWVQHHIIPFHSVDLHDVKQLKKVCHYTNIVPMWEDEHIELHKHDKKSL